MSAASVRAYSSITINFAKQEKVYFKITTVSL